VNVHIREYKAARLKVVRPRGKFKREKRIYTISLVPKKDREVAYFSYQKCTVIESVVCYLTSQFHFFFLDFTFPCVVNLVLLPERLERQDLDLEVRGLSLGSGLLATSGGAGTYRW
jgi:hypothetical protein